MKHIQSFCDYYGIENGSKKWWDSLPCENTEKFKVRISNGFFDRVLQTTFDNWDDAENYADKLTSRNRFMVAYVEDVA